MATEQVMDVLWPDLPPEAAPANLHRTTTLARQAMGLAAAPPSSSSGRGSPPSAASGDPPDGVGVW